MRLAHNAAIEAGVALLAFFLEPALRLVEIDVGAWALVRRFVAVAYHGQLQPPYVTIQQSHTIAAIQSRPNALTRASRAFVRRRRSSTAFIRSAPGVKQCHTAPKAEAPRGA